MLGYEKKYLLWFYINRLKSKPIKPGWKKETCFSLLTGQ